MTSLHLRQKTTRYGLPYVRARRRASPSGKGASGHSTPTDRKCGHSRSFLSRSVWGTHAFRGFCSNSYIWHSVPSAGDKALLADDAPPKRAPPPPAWWLCGGGLPWERGSSLRGLWHLLAGPAVGGTPGCRRGWRWLQGARRARLWVRLHSVGVSKCPRAPANPGE